MIVVLELFEYYQYLSGQLVQSIEEYVHELLSNLVASLEQLISDFLEEELRVGILDPDLRVLQRDLFEAPALRKSKEVL